MAIYYLFEWQDESQFTNGIGKANIVGRFDDNVTLPKRALELWHLDKSNEIDKDPTTQYIADAETEQWSNDEEMLTLDYSLICNPPQIWHCKMAYSKMQSDQPKPAPDSTLENPASTGIDNMVSFGNTSGIGVFDANNPVPSNAPLPSNIINAINNALGGNASNANNNVNNTNTTALPDHSNDALYNTIVKAISVDLNNADAISILNNMRNDIEDGFGGAYGDATDATKVAEALNDATYKLHGSNSDDNSGCIEKIIESFEDNGNDYDGISQLIMEVYDFEALNTIVNVLNITDTVHNQILKWQVKQDDYVNSMLESYFAHDYNNGLNGRAMSEDDGISLSDEAMDILSVYPDECETQYGVENPLRLISDEIDKDDAVLAMNELEFPDIVKQAILDKRAELGYDIPSNANTIGFTNDDTQTADDTEQNETGSSDSNDNSSGVDINADVVRIFTEAYGKQLSDDDKQTIKEQFAEFTEDDMDSLVNALGINDSDKQILKNYRNSLFDNHDNGNNADIDSITDDEIDDIAMQMVAMTLGFNADSDGLIDAHNAIITMIDDEFKQLMASLILTEEQESMIENIRKNGSVKTDSTEQEQVVGNATTSLVNGVSARSTSNSTSSQVDASKYVAIKFPIGKIKGNLYITGNAKPMALRKLARALGDDNPIQIQGRNVRIVNNPDMGFTMNAANLLTTVDAFIKDANDSGLQIAGELITPVDYNTIRIITITHKKQDDNDDIIVNDVESNDIIKDSDGLFHAPDGRIGKYEIIDK